MKKLKKQEKNNVKKLKTVKKNTLYRKFRAWVLHIEHRQKNDTPSVYVRDNASHVCKHCGSEYTGAYCPKCSMPARWRRFNWKLLFLNFMDIWGLGNRPMFRTIRDLFWRPGYMIKDYLRGHQLSYFPPFKMLAVWTVLVVFVIWLVNITVGAEQKFYVDRIEEAMHKSPDLKDLLDHLTAFSSFVIHKTISAFAFLEKNLLYRLIIQNILVVLAVKWAFRKVSNFNLVETFISQIYINCQFHIIGVVSMLLTWRVFNFGFFPYINSVLLPIPLVLAYDFHQLYGITWKRAIWKTIVIWFYMVLLCAAIVLLVSGILILVEGNMNPELETYLEETVNAIENDSINTITPVDTIK